MNAVEKLLRKGLESDPADWSVRMELAKKLADRDASTEAAEILGEAPAPPETEDEMQEAIDAAGGLTTALQPLMESFVQENPSSAWAHHCLALLFAGENQSKRARKHYETSVALNAEFADPEFEKELNPEVAEAVSEPEPEIVPVATASPLRPPEKQEPEPAIEPETSVPEASEAAVSVNAIDHDDAGDLETEEFELLPLEDDPIDHHHRALIVGEGEMVHAHDKTSDTTSKISALTTAVLIHVGIIALLALIVVSMPRPNPPQLIASSLSSNADDDIAQEKVERIQRRPSESAAAQMQVISTPTASPVAMPDIQTDNLTFDPIGVGDSFGMSMNFTDENGAGMVSFFGSKSKAQKVLFVVDASASMKSKGSAGKEKFVLMKEELIRSIEALPPSVEFQIIFFSGPAWFVGDEEDRKDWHAWEKNGKKLNFWHYKDGEPGQLPVGKYIDASKSKIRKTSKDIEAVKMSLGTDWRAPLEMAMGMKPDVIFFMTDGAVGNHPDKPDVVDHLIDYNKEMSSAKINTICLMQLNAFEDLKALADRSKGEFTLVLEDGTTVRGRDVEKMAVKKKK